jgi:hypothetical protein
MEKHRAELLLCERRDGLQGVDRAARWHPHFDIKRVADEQRSFAHRDFLAPVSHGEWRNDWVPATMAGEIFKLSPAARR